MSYNRALSPGSRRIANPARASDSNVDSYLSSRHDSYASPRSSGERVIPISTQTYVSVPSSSSSGARSSTASYDSHARTRRNSLLDGHRGSVTSSTRSRPNVIQGSDSVRPSSPSRKERDYYVTPASTRDARDGREQRRAEHRKVYSVDDGGAKLVADLDLRTRDEGKKHKSREHSGYPEDRARRAYPVSRRDKSIDDDDAFSYTDAAGMFRETQPSWRDREHEYRPRRSSIDRSASTRERSGSMLDTYSSDVRKSVRENGPPPSQRGWDKINEGIGRTRSVREGPREVAHSPSRGRDLRSQYNDSNETRHSSKDRNRTSAVYDRDDDRVEGYDVIDRREPRDHERRWSATRPADRSVSRRGFGIRLDSPERQGGRHSNESLNGQRPLGRDSGYAEPARRDILSDDEHRNTDRRRREDDRNGPRHDGRRKDVKRHDVDSEDDRYYRDPPRRNTVDDRDRRHRRDDSQDRHGDGLTNASKLAAAGGLGAAALYGLNKDRDRHDDRPRHERDVLHPPIQDKDHRSRSRSDDDARHNEPRSDPDRGLGFAFEAPAEQAGKIRFSAPPEEEQASSLVDEKVGRHREDTTPAVMPPTPVDPDEDYRQRLQQMQVELGVNNDTSSTVDPDRERRRRERDARLREKQERVANGDTTAGAYSDERSPLRASFDDNAASSIVSSPIQRPGELQRRSSIVDMAMPEIPTAQIIDNSSSDHRENRVRIVDPPTEEEEKKPKSILKKPTQKFPELKNAMREGVAPLKDATKKGIPPGARWTKIDRRLVNPEALEEAKERYEERLECVIVLRVLTKEDIQKLADRTKELRNKRFDAEDRVEKRSSRHHDRDRDRRDRDEYSDDGLEDWERGEKKPVRMLEAAPPSDYSDRKSEQRDREGSYVSSSRSHDY